MLTVSGHTSWKRAFIQTTHTMPRGANVIFICPILMAMSFHLLVRSSVESHASEIHGAQICFEGVNRGFGGIRRSGVEERPVNKKRRADCGLGAGIAKKWD